MNSGRAEARDSSCRVCRKLRRETGGGLRLAGEFAQRRSPLRLKSRFALAISNVDIVRKIENLPTAVDI